MKQKNPAQQERLTRLLSELIKNSRKSERDLAKIMDTSQPTVNRLRKSLEEQAILQYTLIPNFAYIGYDIIAFMFVRSKDPMTVAWRDEGRKFAMEQPNVLFASTGQGMESTGMMISVHKDYADFTKFHQDFRREWGKHLAENKTFLISVKGDITVKPFSFDYLAECMEKELESPTS